MRLPFYRTADCKIGDKLHITVLGVEFCYIPSGTEYWLGVMKRDGRYFLYNEYETTPICQYRLSED